MFFLTFSHEDNNSFATYFQQRLSVNWAAASEKRTSAFDPTLQTFGVSTSSDLLSFPWLALLGKSEQRFHLLCITKPTRPPNVNTKVTCSIMLLHSIPNISNPIHYFAGGKCHWQCEIEERIMEVESEGMGGFSNTKVSCLKIKASTAV